MVNLIKIPLIAAFLTLTMSTSLFAAVEAGDCEINELPNGAYTYLEEGVGFADAVITRIKQTNQFKITISHAEEGVGLKDGHYKLELTQTPADIGESNLYSCTVRIFDAQNHEFTPLFPSDTPSKRFFSGANVMTNPEAEQQGLEIRTRDALPGGCGGEGSSGMCPPRVATFIKN